MSDCVVHLLLSQLLIIVEDIGQSLHILALSSLMRRHCRRGVGLLWTEVLPPTDVDDAEIGLSLSC